MKFVSYMLSVLSLSCLGPMPMRGKFLWKMLHLNHGYVTCLYARFYLVGDACAQIVAILLFYVSILACCSALCIFEKHMLAFVDLIHPLRTRGRKVPNSCFRGSFASREEKLGEMHLFRGILHSYIWELFFAWILVVHFCWWCRALLHHLEESATLGHFISVMSSCFPCLRGPRFFSLKWSCFGFCLFFVWVFLLFLFFFSFIWIGYLCVLSMHSSSGRLRTGASEDRWMVAPGCDEWLTTWCGLTLGRVLQVQVAAWFVLVRVKSGRERSMPCGASEEWRDK
jgi:hypothetical protein